MQVITATLIVNVGQNLRKLARMLLMFWFSLELDHWVNSGIVSFGDLDAFGGAHRRSVEPLLLKLYWVPGDLLQWVTLVLTLRFTTWVADRADLGERFLSCDRFEILVHLHYDGLLLYLLALPVRLLSIFIFAYGRL